MTDKFSKGFRERIKPRVDYVSGNGEAVKEPFRDAQLSLQRGQFAAKEREEFFNEAFTDILTDLFTQWVKTEPHCTKEREFLYHTALALGSVKENLIRRETLGKNAKFIQKPQEEDKETDE
jgi:hypothetical protein